MNKFFKKALVTAAFAMSLGFAVYMGETNMPAVQAEADVSGGNAGGSTTTSGNSGSSQTTSGNSGGSGTTSGNSGSSQTTSGNSGSTSAASAEAMQKATSASAKAADGTTVSVKVTAVTSAVLDEAEQQSWSSVDAGNGVYYYRDYSASIVTVDVAVEGAKPDGNINVTLNHASIEAGATYVVNHKKSNGVWERKVVKAGADGVLDVELSSLSPVSFYKVYEYDYAYWNEVQRAAGFNRNLNEMIAGTAEGGVIRITKEDGRDSLTMETVKRIVDRDLTLVMEYTYNGADYRIVIPGKKAVIDESVPIYGPLYLAAHYSSNAAVGGSSNGVTYTIAKGDTLSKIAATNGTTVAALAVLNPQIKDVNVIYTGQTINLQ